MIIDNTIPYIINSNDSISLDILGYANISPIDKKLFFNSKYNSTISNEISKLSDFFIDKLNLDVTEISISKINFKNLMLLVKIKINDYNDLDLQFINLETEIYSDNYYTNLLGTSKLDTIISNSNNLFSHVELKSVNFTKYMLQNSIKRENILFLKINSILKMNNLLFPLSIKKKFLFNPMTFESQLK